MKIRRSDTVYKKQEVSAEPNKTPEQEKARNSKVHAFIQIALIILVIALSTYLLFSLYDYYHEPAYTANEVIEELPEPTATPEPTTQSEQQVQQEKELPNYKNQVGILTVDGVDVTNEAVMQHPTEDEYYLYKNESGKYSIWGSYFVYHDWNMQSIESLDKVTVIFGHSNGNSLYRKFSVLKHFKDAEFAKQHQYIYLTIGGEKSRWKIFAAADYPIANNYVQANPSDEFLQWEIDQMKAYSYNHYQADVSAEDKILILSTCTGSDAYETRFIVCAVYDGLC